MVGLGSMAGYGIQSMLKEGHRHLSGLEEAVLKNIDTCRELSAITRTSLGPNGMNKMVINHLIKLFVTNDAATIVNELEVQHPAAKAGVTTLTRALSDPCMLCLESMEAGEKVRTLSCNHVFHCGGTFKCENGIDRWLLTAKKMVCPLCRKSPRPVQKQPLTLSPPPSPSASALYLEEALLLPVHWFDEALPELASSSQ